MTDESHPKLVHCADLAFYLMKKALKKFFLALRSEILVPHSTLMIIMTKITFRDHLLLAMLCLCIKKDVQSEIFLKRVLKYHISLTIFKGMIF